MTTKRKPTMVVKKKDRVTITDEYIDNFISMRAENIHNSPTLSKVAKVDRDYLMGIFALLYRKHVDFFKKNDPRANPGRRYTPREMFHASSKYMQVTIEHGQPLTITALGIFLGIRRPKLIDMVQNARTSPNEQFLVDYADFIESYNEYAAHKKQNPAGPIFVLKNFGWKDKFEIEASDTKGALTEKEREEAQHRVNNFSEIMFELPIKDGK